MRRRGRPRKSGPREANGRLQRAADPGSLRLQQLRAWFAQGGDPALTGYPLGVLLANQQISEAQHRAGCRYAWLHAMARGRPSVSALAFERLGRSHEGEWDEVRLAELTDKLRSTEAVLSGAPTALRRILDDVAIYERAPRFMLPVRPATEDIREADRLFAALDLLARHFSRPGGRRDLRTGS